MAKNIFHKPLSAIVFCSLLVCSASNHAYAASAVVTSQFVGDFDIASGETVSFDVDFSAASSVSGIGLVTDWTAVVADNSDGLNPWALDLRVRATSPDGSQLNWDPIGGDVTIADYPLADFSPHYTSPQSGGQYSIEFDTPGVPSPFVSGLRTTTVYAIEQVPDVVEQYNGSVADGPTWNRPFFIEGISSLGPVVYDVLEFTVPVSGGYEFLSVLPSGNNNFNFMYRGGFDPDAPLDNLLDYGLGNGFAQNGTPRGTSLIESLLLEGETYYYVTSQFERFISGGDFETTITGPSAISRAGSNPSGDFDGDGNFGCVDLDLLYEEILGGTNDQGFDLTGDGIVDSADLSAWLIEAGEAELGAGKSFLVGDANLDGFADSSDFNVWNNNKFTQGAGWCGGDFDADGFTDGSDFNSWNNNKFASSDVAIVPEPSMVFWHFLFLIGIGGLALPTRRRFTTKSSCNAQ